MTWSYSGLKQFENCPRQYYEMSVAKNYPWKDSDQQRYGRDMHKAAELYVKEGTPFPKQFEFMKPVTDAVLSKSGARFAEVKLALNAELKPCRWMAKDVWVRGIVDLLILDGPNQIAWAVDWKTGNDKYVDKDQLDLMSLLIFAHYPTVQRVNSALIYVLSDGFFKHRRVKEEEDPLWWTFRERVAKIDAAKSAGVWHPSPSGLCKKHCDVITCEHNGRTG